MDLREYSELSRNSRLIPGIYNYCDQWCERCAFTSRCLHYLIQHDKGKEGDKGCRDQEKRKIVWEELKETLDETIELLEELMRAQGLDPDLPGTDDGSFYEEEKQLHEKARHHPLTRQVERYVRLATSWLKKATEVQKVTKKVPEKHAVWSEAAKVLRHYLGLIPAKTGRALLGQMRFERQAQEAYLDDARGSAKVALLGMDASLQAWQTLLKIFPEEANSLADILIRLEELKQETELIFPAARSFRRPGFDDPV